MKSLLAALDVAGDAAGDGADGRTGPVCSAEILHYAA